MHDWQLFFGVKVSSLLAGLAGGLVRALMMRSGLTKWQVFVSCIVGALTAGYLTPVFMHVLPYHDAAGAEGAVGYAIGLSAMYLCEGVMRAAKSWRDDPKLPPP